MRTLFLNPPSFEGFDGGAGSRYQAKREVRSFYYPTWLAQPAALVPDSRLVDAPARGLDLDQVLALARDFELVVMHTSTPSFFHDARTAAAIKAANNRAIIGFVGAHVATLPQEALAHAPAVDFAAGSEFDFTVKEVADGVAWDDIRGLSFRRGGAIHHNAPRPPLEDMDLLPHVVDVYRRDLVIEDYYNGYLLHPYVSFYTGRGCKSRCTFCLWPQTVGGHRYRVRSVEHVLAEVEKVQRYFPQAKEIFFDDDTLTDNLPRVEAIARGLGRLGVSWSCNAKGNVPLETLRILKDNGLRLFVVGYESGNQQILHNIKKGMLVERARRFSEDCHKLGIKIHGTFIMGLPGETRETIRETMRFAAEVNPQTIQVSLAAAYPGTYLYEQAKREGWLTDAAANLVDPTGVQVCALEYPDLSGPEIVAASAEFYRRFYLRPRKILQLLLEMGRSRDELVRRLREGMEFFRFLAARDRADTPAGAAGAAD